MDKNNKGAIDVACSAATSDEAGKLLVAHVFKHPESGKPLSYAQMRSFYG